MRRIPLVPGLLALGAVVVGGAFLGGRLARAVRRRSWRARPGRSRERPWRVTEIDEVEEVIGGSHCHCGGRLEPLRSGDEMGVDGTVRVARARCRACGAEHDLFFDLREVRH